MHRQGRKTSIKTTDGAVEELMIIHSPLGITSEVFIYPFEGPFSPPKPPKGAEGAGAERAGRACPSAATRRAASAATRFSSGTCRWARSHSDTRTYSKRGFLRLALTLHRQAPASGETHGAAAGAARTGTAGTALLPLPRARQP